MKRYVLSLMTACLLTVSSAALAATGAIWTTNSGCGGVNINLFNCKGDVYLNGGPSGGGGGLPDGNYYVQVTDPSGATVLGKTPTPVAQVVGGHFVICYHLVDILYTASSSFTTHGYDTTPNNGNEYKVWASMDPSFTGSTNKTDNFKVSCCPTCGCTDCGGGGGGGGGGGEGGSISGTKFLDLNLNGKQDLDGLSIAPCGSVATTTTGEPGISGWHMQLYQYNGAGIPSSCSDLSGWTQVGSAATNSSGAYTFSNITTAGYYMVKEVFPVNTPCGVWEPTTLATCLIVDMTTLQAITGQDFGNICFSTAGLTMGYYKTHAGFSKGAKLDPVYSGIGIQLGTGCLAPVPPYGGTDAYVINSAQKAYNIFVSADASGTGKAMLAGQLLAAKLNVIKFGSCNFDCAIYVGNVSAYFLMSVHDIIHAADIVLCDTTATKDQVTALIEALDEINNNESVRVLENQGGCAVSY